MAGLLACPLLAGCSSGSADPDPGPVLAQVPGGPYGMYVVPAGIHKIKHVIIVMQENRSFDSYFGTFPGADGIPMLNQVPVVCAPNPAGGCDQPHHDTADVNGGGPHAAGNAVADVDGGRMDGFIRQRHAARSTCTVLGDPACHTSGAPDLMGYHNAAEIPNYWAYARDFVLQDHMFEAVRSWSLPDRLYLVSGWSARCASRSASSCVTDITGPYGVAQMQQLVDQEVTTGTAPVDLAWTDITWLLHAHHVSWAYYIQPGTQPDCANDSAETCAPARQTASALGIWNPLPLFGDVQQDHQLNNIRPLSAYLAAARAGTLPAVS